MAQVKQTDIFELLGESSEVEYTSDDCYTPKWLVESATKVLGEIDLDPATSQLANKVVQAKRIHTIKDSGLAAWGWCGRVWLNPPYSDPEPWVKRLVEEFIKGRTTEALLLTNVDTSTQWFQYLMEYQICFFNKRIQFDKPEGAVNFKGNNNRNPQCITYLGPMAKYKLFNDEFSRYGNIMQKTNTSLYSLDKMIQLLEGMKNGRTDSQDS